MRPILAACAILLPTVASAQVTDPPFFQDGGVGLFDPTVEVVNSGALLDAQAVVSPDRRYVTITMRATNTALIALETFAVQHTRALGTVGDANPGVLGRSGMTPISGR